MQSSFYAMMSRMKNISRWSLMRNTQRETLSEHSLETAIIAHALCEIHNRRLTHLPPVNAERAVLLAIFHDANEILTGDMPTPAKYHSPALREAYTKLEQSASEKLLSYLPEDLRPGYKPLLCTQNEADAYLHKIVKAADKLSALIKCVEERRAGNLEFVTAGKATLESIKSMGMPESDIFVRDFVPSFSKTLDEQGR